MIPLPTRDGRSGDWFATHSGTQFFLTDPHPDDVHIGDIAHALSQICRFGGHTREFYSVGQHVVHCSDLVAKWGGDTLLQLDTLLHDASEAYLGDVVRPLKYSMPDYIALEEKTMAVIYQGLGLSYPPSAADRAIIKRADDTLLMTERRDLIYHRDLEWGIHNPPLDAVIMPLSPSAAKYRFMRLYDQLRLELATKAAA